MIEPVIWIWVLGSLTLMLGLGRLFSKGIESDLGPIASHGPTEKIILGDRTVIYLGRSNDRVWLNVTDRGEHIEVILSPEQGHELAKALNDHAVDSVIWAEQQKDS